MFIHEAIAARSPEHPYIVRKAWQGEYLLNSPNKRCVRILPTSSPDGCIVIGGYEKDPRIGWKPTAEDLTADDWESVR